MRKAKLLLILQVFFYVTFWISSPIILIFFGSFPAMIFAIIGFAGLMIIRKIRRYFLKNSIAEIHKIYNQEFDFIKGGLVPKFPDGGILHSKRLNVVSCCKCLRVINVVGPGIDSSEKVICSKCLESQNEIHAN